MEASASRSSRSWLHRPISAAGPERAPPWPKRWDGTPWTSPHQRPWAGPRTAPPGTISGPTDLR
eukprot:7312065-Alexandrium_andersonii.AAC.1